MAENVVTNANDVEVVLEAQGVGGSMSTTDIGRFIVDEFTLTRNEEDETVSGISVHFPEGFSNGNVTFEFEWTMMGSDTDVFRRVSTENGRSRVVSLTARKTNDDGDLEWEFALGAAKATSEEVDLSSGDTMEYPVSGIGMQFERLTN
jgi:hypothetical protein